MNKCTCFVKEFNMPVGEFIETSYEGVCGGCGNSFKFWRIWLVYQGDVDDENGVGFYHFFTPRFPFSCRYCGAIPQGVQFFCFPGKYEFISQNLVRTYPIDCA